MNTRSHSRLAARRGFSLMELLLAMGIMTVIIGALYGMFHHTQKALRANVTQVDVLESGRAAMEQITREIEQMAPSFVSGGTNFLTYRSPVYGTNIQTLMAGGSVRTNYLEELFFVSRYGREFSGTMYRVLFATNGVGTLARYSTNLPTLAASPTNFARFVTNALGQAPTNFVALVDGVIHFRLQAYDPNGFPLAFYLTNNSPTYRVHRVDEGGRVLQTTVNSNLVVRPVVPVLVPGETRVTCLSNALPAYVEVELGLLEPRAYEQYRAFPTDSPMAHKYLAGRAAQVHLFRQRIPIRQAVLQKTAHP